MQEPLDLAGVLGLNSLGLVLEHINELATDEFALLLRVVYTLQTSQELFTGIDDSQVDAQLLLEDILNQSALIQAHTAVVNQNGVESVTNGLGHQLGGHGRVNTTADSTKDLALRADEVADPLDLLTDEFGHGPVLRSAANTHGEILQELTALRGV